jgi:hypothetical protein
MRSFFRFAGLVVALAVTLPAWCASKPHVVSLGKPQTVKIFFGQDESQSATVSVRPLYVDAKLKDYTMGEAHEVTDRQFVVQRAYRLNDSLPGEPTKQNTWMWQRGDWLLIDRVSGHIAQLKLPEFDAANSHLTWYRDFAAYYGTPDSGARWDAVVSQIGVRKPLFRKELAKATGSESSAGNCPAMKWERHPSRVTFSPIIGEPFTVNVVPHHAEELLEDNDSE